MLVTLLTDFGDFYPGVMKGVILSLVPDAKIVDITHSIEPQNVFQGAFLLYHSYKFFRSAIHVAIVDPGVGGKRRAIVVETKHNYFVAPDNGLVYPSAKEDGIVRIFEIDSKISEIVGELSTTFHGRDIFAPATALLLKKDFRYFREIDEIKTLDIFEHSVAGNRVCGKVAFVDRFGNVVTNIPASAVMGAKGFILRGVEFPMVKCYEDVDIGKPLALIGSFGTLELSLREGNASEFLKIRKGEIELEVLR
ncbi:MAG: S-adenosyl-l-methionine hydroxide adenosyltransferase family protein [Archaeoglobaceae archaeon]